MSEEALQLTVQVTGQENVDVELHPAGNANARFLEHAGFNITNKQFNQTSTLKPVGPVVATITIGGSAHSLDLTAAPQALGRTIDLTGKKLLAVLLRANADNAGDITVKAHGTNGYLLFGTSGQHVLGPGGWLACGDLTQLNRAAVSGTAKIIEISGTEDDVLDLELIFATPPA